MLGGAVDRDVAPRPLAAGHDGAAFDVAAIPFTYDNTTDGPVAPGDDGSVLINIGFSFPFAGNNWTQVYVGGNGLVSFGTPPNPGGATPMTCPG